MRGLGRPLQMIPKNPVLICPEDSGPGLPDPVPAVPASTQKPIPARGCAEMTNVQ
jgi:hypothetical protein